MKRWKILCSTLLAIPLFTGCATEHDELGVNNDEFRHVGYEGNLENRGIIPNGNIRYIHEDSRNQMEVADGVADNLVTMDGISWANVIVTENNAYVAVVVEDELTNDLEMQISDKVKTVDRSIQHIYVSANPDFVKNMTDYGNKIQDGEPIEGLFEEFNQMISRVFPNAVK